jgi:hypothetical protein
MTPKGRTLRALAGSVLRDWPRFEMTLHGLGAYRRLRTPWVAMRNRNERLTLDGRGARCEWIYTSDLHIAKMFPAAARRLLDRALRDWPIEYADVLAPSDKPDVTFVIGHRGTDRLPQLLNTLRSIAAQRGPIAECIVVEQSGRREIEAALPTWVRYLHTPPPREEYDYNRGWAFNVGARAARAELLIFHDNDMPAPSHYAEEALARMREGWSFIDLKRFIFYLDADGVRITNVLQNALGGSIAVSREAFFEIGGFDESFVGWGGEDNELRERADAAGRVYSFGYLPFLHLFHPPQPGKVTGETVQRYHELKNVPARERIEALRAREWGSTLRPSGEPGIGVQ